MNEKITERNCCVKTKKCCGARFWLALFFLLNVAGIWLLLVKVESTRPAGALAVTSHSPTGNTETSVGEIVFEFSAPLNPESVRDNAVILQPRLGGTVRLVEPHRLVFKFKEPPKNATRYEYSLSQELRGALGESAPKDKFSFNTPPLSVTDVSQTKIGMDHSIVLDFSFSGTVNPRDLVKFLEISDGEKLLTIEPVGEKPDRNVSIRLLNAETDRVDISIKQGLPCSEGPLGLAENFGKEVEISYSLRITGMSAETDYGRNAIEIYTTTPVELATAPDFIQVEPAVKYTFESMGYGFRLQGDFTPATRYTVTAKAGLSAGAAGKLDKNVVRNVWFPDASPSIYFNGDYGYLSPNGLLKVPFNSVNIDKAFLSVEKLYENNLVEFALDGQRHYSNLFYKTLNKSVIKIENVKNQSVETLLGLREILGQNTPLGVYAFELTKAEKDSYRRYYYNDAANSLQVITDLGITSREAGSKTSIWITSLTKGEPVAGAQIKLYSNKRQLIGTAVTDANGLAEIENKSKAPDDSSEETAPAVDEYPALITAVKDTDLSFLDLRGNRNSRHSDAYVARPYLVKSYEIYAFPERGVYRPGDTVKLSALIRGVRWTVPPEMPIEVEINRGNRLFYSKQNVKSDSAGRILAELKIPYTAPSGYYDVTYRIPGQRTLGHTDFQVAEYVPQTIRMNLSLPEDKNKSKEESTVKATAQYLFGDAAKGLKTTCRATFTDGSFRSDKWQGYDFCVAPPKPIRPREVELEKQTFDQNGEAVFTIKTPDDFEAPVINLNASVEAFETGGRALTQNITRHIYTYDAYLGIKTSDKSYKTGEDYNFTVVAVQKDGLPAKIFSEDFNVEIKKITYSNVLRRSRGSRLHYEWTREEVPAGEAKGKFIDGVAGFNFKFEQAGDYVFLIESEPACPVKTSLYVCGPNATWAMADQEDVTLRLERKIYRVGETAKLQIRSPFGGKALLCVEADRIISSRIVDLPAGESTQDFVVEDGWRPNVYLTVQVIRPVQPEKDWRAHRASGIVRLDVDASDRKIDLVIETPPSAVPEKELRIIVKASANNLPQANTALIIAAVDEGVLALSDYETPSPAKFFYGPRRLDIQASDMFSQLSPELEAWKLGKKPAPGGDGVSYNWKVRALSARLSPMFVQRIKTASLYMGALVTDAQGQAVANFTVPEYVGELRVMVIAANGMLLGSTAKALTVKSPLMVRSSLPRFLAPGDECEVPISVYNRTGKDGQVEVTAKLEGPLELTTPVPLKIDVKNDEEKTVAVKIRARSVGKVKVQFVGTLGAEISRDTVELPVRPATAFTHVADTVEIKAGQPNKITVPKNFVPETASVSVTISGNPTIELAGAMRYLLHYPYGCVEQTTSTIVPLIYLSDLAALSDPKMFAKSDAEEYIDNAILRLKMMQTYSGGLAMWPGNSNPDEYGSIYAADILLEAKKANFNVPENLLSPLLKYLRERTDNYIAEKSYGNAAYACYVLSRAGTPPYSLMGTLEEIFKSDEVSIPSCARYRLAAAYLALGEKTAARDFIANTKLPAPDGERQLYGYLNSPARETAVMLLIALDLETDNAKIAALAKNLKDMMSVGDAWNSTQENAFALMALGKYARKLQSDPNAQLTITLPDGKVEKVSAARGFSSQNLKPGDVITVEFDGKSQAFAFLSVEGLPTEGDTPEKDSGFTLRRDFFEMDGKTKADPLKLKQGRIYNVRLTLATNVTLKNMAVLELLPAGLELVDPNLKGMPKSEYKPMSAEFIERRDDRIIFFTSAAPGKNCLWYETRAVSPGEFILPPADASCMYNSGLYSVNGKGKVKVERQ